MSTLLATLLTIQIIGCGSRKEPEKIKEPSIEGTTCHYGGYKINRFECVYTMPVEKKHLSYKSE